LASNSCGTSLVRLFSILSVIILTFYQFFSSINYLKKLYKV